LPAVEADGATAISARAAAQLNAAVRDAGSLALSMFGKPIKQWTKGPSSSPVCEADIAIDALLRERLTGGNPFAWLSEETADDAARLAARYVWVVDPIDGTRAYVNGRTDWSISIALVEHGRPIAGAVFAPMEDGLYLAVAGEGVTRDGAPLAVSSSASFEGAHAAGPKPILSEFAKAAPRIVAEPKVHSLALRLARVASGRLDIAFASKNSHDWDLAAADLIVHEAGGAMTTLEGETAVYNSAETRHGALVATGSARHDPLIAITRQWRPRGALHESLA
jgi:myo-inositol-1(or 4)-monophosphatase